MRSCLAQSRGSLPQGIGLRARSPRAARRRLLPHASRARQRISSAFLFRGARHRREICERDADYAAALRPRAGSARHGGDAAADRAREGAGERPRGARAHRARHAAGRRQSRRDARRRGLSRAHQRRAAPAGGARGARRRRSRGGGEALGGAAPAGGSSAPAHLRRGAARAARGRRTAAAFAARRAGEGRGFARAVHCGGARAAGSFCRASSTTPTSWCARSRARAAFRPLPARTELFER